MTRPWRIPSGAVRDARDAHSGWSMVRTGGTHRCRPTNTTDCPAWFVGAGMSSDTLRHKAAVLHPLTGWGRRPSALPGDCAICGWRFGTLGVFRPLRRAGVSRRARRGSFARCGGRVFRAVRGAGVSPAAAGGCFAGCGQRPGALPPGPLRFFEKNRVKLLFLGASGKKRTRCRSSASLFIQFTASWNSPATAGQPEHG